MRFTEITDERAKEVIAFYEKPNSAKEVYRVYGIALCTLYKLLENYGIKRHDKATYTSAGQDRAKKTCLAKYGVESSNQAKKVKEKKQQTWTAKYGEGVTSPSQAKEVQDKIRKTNLEKYGVENVFQADWAKDKLMQTCLDRYGNKYYTKTSDYRQKTTQTCQTKYGTNLYAQSLDYAKTCHKKYKYNDILFDSSWELALWIYAIDHNEEIERVPMQLTFSFAGAEHYCLPDFRYKGQLIELKGEQFIKNGKFICPYDTSKNELFEAKQKCLIENSVQIWTKPKIKFALDYVKNTYGKNFLQQFRLT